MNVGDRGHVLMGLGEWESVWQTYGGGWPLEITLLNEGHELRSVLVGEQIYSFSKSGRESLKPTRTY